MPKGKGRCFGDYYKTIEYNMMRTLVTFMLCLVSVTVFAQAHDEISLAMEEFDYDKVIHLIAPDTKDSLLLSTRIQALKAMNRYPEAIVGLTSLIVKDSADTKVLIDLAECYKLMGSPRQAANYYQKAVSLRPENKFFRLQYIRSLLNAEDFKEAREACHGWLEQDTVSATGYKYLGQAYEGMQDIFNAFFSYNIAYRRDSLDAQTVARIANIFNNNQQFADAVDVTERYRLTDTTSVDVNRQNAKAYCMLKDYKTAIERYESLKRMGDRSFLTSYYLGISYYGDNWFYGSYDNLKEAYAKDPTDINVLYYYAKSCSRTSWKKEGVEFMEKAVEIASPNDSILERLYKGLAECYGYAGEIYKKIEAMNHLYKLNKDYKLFYSIARAYDLNKDYENAVHFYEKFMSLTPKNQRFPYDEEGKLIESATTTYQVAEKRVQKIKEEDFFKNGAPDDFFFAPKKIDIKKDTIVAK